MKKMLLVLGTSLLLSITAQAGYVVIEKKSSSMKCDQSALIISTKALNDVLPKSIESREIRFHASVAHFGCEAILSKFLEKDYLVMEIKSLRVGKEYLPTGELKWCNYEQNGDEFCFEKVTYLEKYILNFEIAGFSGSYVEEIPESIKIIEDMTINGSCPIYQPDCDL